MKYGKLLAKATRLSNPAWRKYWMDYGELKRLIGLIAEETGGPEARTSAEQPGATKEPESPSGTPKKAFSANKKVTPTRIASLPSERQFFVELKKNLELVCKFYDGEEQLLLARILKLKENIDAAEKIFQIGGAKLHDGELEALKGTMRHFVDSLKVLYVDLMMLENFAVMNYAGFAKILKKHDKNTPFVTQEKYLRKVVNPQTFALYFGLKQGIKTVEDCFQRLGALMSASDDEGEMASATVKPIIELNKHNQDRLQNLAKLSGAGKFTIEREDRSKASEEVDNKRKTEALTGSLNSKRAKTQ
jgi:hypothetical protein